MKNKLTIGTRGSKLALWQANWVKDRLTEAHDGLVVDISVIKTRGDKILDVPLAKVGGKGLFVKEIEEALLDGRVDLAVHSMKDMPADMPEGLCMGPVPERENPRDVLISRSGDPLAELTKGAVVGTSSLRRGAQLKHARPDIEIVSLRGNLDTRLKKLEAGGMDAIVLAAAGVRRLGLAHRITEELDESVMLPAVAQGALCIQLRCDDGEVQDALSVLNHEPTRTVVTGERAFLKRLGGSCQIPVAGHGGMEGGRFSLTGLVADIDGGTVFREQMSGPAEDSQKIGTRLADRLLDQGAREILEELTEGTHLNER